MKMVEVSVVRIYLNEHNSNLDNLLKRLHDWEKVRGVTVFRGVTGFGESGQIHSASFIDLSLDLPLVVEFFDEPAKVEQILENMNSVVKPRHILKWTAWMNETE